MTVEQLQDALRISDQQLQDLKPLAADFAKFDEALARSSPEVRELANEGFNSQFAACAQTISQLVNLPPSEVELLILLLLGLVSGTATTTGPSIMALSALAQKLEA